MRLRDMPRDLLVLTFAMIIANISGAMITPLLPLYLESLGASVQNIGFFFTMQIILAIIFRILGGWISDNMGRLPTIAVGGLMGMAARVAFVLAPTWEWALVGALF